MDVKHFWLQHDAALPEHANSPQGELSHDLYRGMPPWFNAYYAFFQKRAVLKLLARCGPLAGLRAVDVGCGTGRWTELLANFLVWPVGVDFGLRAVHFAAASRRGGYFCAAALPQLCFADNAFDLAVCVTVLQHVPRAEQEDAVAALARVLAPGGRLIAFELVDPGDSASHVFARSADAWRALFESVGLRPIDYAPCEYLPYVKWFQRVRAWRAKRSSTDIAPMDVTTVAMRLRQRPVLAGALRLGIALSYPMEYLASWLLPKRWARLGGFLLVKE